MTLGFSWLNPAANPILGGRVIVYALLIIGTWLVLTWPKRKHDWQQARAGQTAVGAVAVLSSLTGFALAALCHAKGAMWLAADGLCNASALLALSMVFFIGSFLLLGGAQKLARTEWNIAGMVGVPAFFLTILDLLALGYLWFGRPQSTPWTASDPDTHGALLLAGMTALLGVIALVATAGLAARHAAPRPALTRAMMIGVIGAAQETLLYMAHVDAKFDLHIGGADLMIAGCILGVAAFFTGVYGEIFSRGLDTVPAPSRRALPQAPRLAVVPSTAQPETADTALPIAA
jgi:hypothetical protein